MAVNRDHFWLTHVLQNGLESDHDVAISDGQIGLTDTAERWIVNVSMQSELVESFSTPPVPMAIGLTTKKETGGGDWPGIMDTPHDWIMWEMLELRAETIVVNGISLTRFVAGTPSWPRDFKGMRTGTEGALLLGMVWGETTDLLGVYAHGLRWYTSFVVRSLVVDMTSGG